MLLRLLLKHNCVRCNDSLEVVGTHALIAPKGMLEEFNLGGSSPLEILIANSDILSTVVAVMESISVAAWDAGGIRPSSSSVLISTGRTRSGIIRRVDRLRGHSDRQWFLADDTQPAKVMGKACSMECMFFVILSVDDVKTTARRGVCAIDIGFIVGVVGSFVDLFPASA